MIELQSSAELTHFLNEHPLVLLYFTTPECAVCHAMKPKIENLLSNFSSPLVYIDAFRFPDLVGQYLVFSSPTLLILEHDRELLRESRFIDLMRVERLMSQYHST
jgi:thiol-disulfide isomerase/thioredoxin